MTVSDLGGRLHTLLNVRHQARDLFANIPDNQGGLQGIPELSYNFADN